MPQTPQPRRIASSLPNRDWHDHRSRDTLLSVETVTGVRPLVARVLHLTGFDEVLFLGGSRAEHEAPPVPVP